MRCEEPAAQYTRESSQILKTVYLIFEYSINHHFIVLVVAEAS